MDLKLSLIIAAIDQATAPLRNVAKSLEGVSAAGDRLKAAGASISSVGQSVGAFAQQGQAALESILAPAQAVEESLAELGNVARTNLGGDVAGTLARTREAAISWSQAHVGSAQEYIAATQKMIALGISEESAISGAASALQFASANKVNAAAATKGLAFAYDNMGNRAVDAGAEMQRLGDVLTKVQQTYQLDNIAALPEAMSKAIPAAKQTGMSFEQLAVTMAALEKAGFKGEGAGASLGQALTNLEGASKSLGFALVKTADGGIDFAGSLKNLEGKVGDLKNMSPEMAKKLQEAFGPGSEAIMKLIGQSGSLQGALEGVAGSAGTAAEAAAAMDRAASAKIFEQNIDALKIELAAGLLPALQQLAPIVTGAIQSFAGFAKENPGIVKVVGTIAVLAVAAASILGPILGGVGAVMSLGGALLGAVPAFLAAASSAGAFALALLANPITWIVLAIVAAAVLIYVYWDEIVAYFAGVWAEIKAAFDVGFVEGIAKVLENLNPAKHVMAAFDFLLQELGGFSLADVGNAIVNGLMAVLGYLNPIAPFTNAWNAVSSYLSGFSLAGVGQGIVDGLMAVFLAFVPLDAIMSGIAGVAGFLSGFSLADAGSNIINTLVAGIQAVASAPADAMAAIVANLRAYLPFSPAKVGPLRDLNKIRLVETVAENIVPGPLEAAMQTAVGGAMRPLTGIPLAPSFAPAMPRPVGAVPTSPLATAAAANTNAAAAAGPIVVHLHIAGDGSPVEQIEAWLRNPTNAGRVAEAVDKFKQARGRTAYG